MNGTTGYDPRIDKKSTVKNGRKSIFKKR